MMSERNRYMVIYCTVQYTAMCAAEFCDTNRLSHSKPPPARQKQRHETCRVLLDDIYHCSRSAVQYSMYSTIIHSMYCTTQYSSHAARVMQKIFIIILLKRGDWQRVQTVVHTVWTCTVYIHTIYHIQIIVMVLTSPPARKNNFKNSNLTYESCDQTEPAFAICWWQRVTYIWEPLTEERRKNMICFGLLLLFRTEGPFFYM